MATGTRTTDTFAEGLRKLLSQMTDLKTTEDADLPFIINLETAVLQRLKQGASDAFQPAGGMPMAGAGMMGGPPMQGPGPSPAGVPGLMQGPNMPNPDELRRVLSQ